nr:MAG TPA: hypothetical protein [Caudoviricetes sp.]
MHKDCQFDSSQNNCLSPRCGIIWSTTVALTSRPCPLHSTHNGCSFRKRLLALRHLLSYPRPEDDSLSGRCSFVCAGQYFPSVSPGHPGCRQGFSGFFGIQSLLPAADINIYKKKRLYGLLHKARYSSLQPKDNTDILTNQETGSLVFLNHYLTVTVQTCARSPDSEK